MSERWQDELKSVEGELAVLYTTTQWELALEGEILTKPVQQCPYIEYTNTDRFRVVATRRQQTIIGDWQIKARDAYARELRAMIQRCEDADKPAPASSSLRVGQHADGRVIILHDSGAVASGFNGKWESYIDGSADAQNDFIQVKDTAKCLELLTQAWAALHKDMLS